MVGRLVEQQQFRAREQHRRQGDPHPPAAGEVRAGTRLGLGIEPQAGQDLGGAGFGRMRLDVAEAGVDLGDPVRVPGGLRLGHQGGPLLVRHQHGLQQAFRPVRRLLGQHAEPPGPGIFDGARIRLELAGDDLQQGRLARAVAPDQAGMVTLGQAEARLGEDLAPGNTVGKVGNGQH